MERRPANLLRLIVASRPRSPGQFQTLTLEKPPSCAPPCRECGRLAHLEVHVGYLCRTCLNTTLTKALGD